MISRGRINGLKSIYGSNEQKSKIKISQMISQLEELKNYIPNFKHTEECKLEYMYNTIIEGCSFIKENIIKKCQ